MELFTTQKQKPFWDVDENKDFIKKTSRIDDLPYKVRVKDNHGRYYPQPSLQQAADILATARYENTKLLLYLLQRPDLWENSDIAPGIILALDIHIPNWKSIQAVDINNPQALININKSLARQRKLYNIQEMTPNDMGIMGLNKPKKIKTVYNKFGKAMKVADKRSLHLTLRDGRTGNLLPMEKIRDLNIHELTHTVNNDIVWKEDNHLPPYEKYHRFMRGACRNCGIL